MAKTATKKPTPTKTKTKTPTKTKATTKKRKPSASRKTTKAHTKLATYRAKRDFTSTAEPSGAKAATTTGNSFVIQKHAARRLHYDFRLELDGVLLSWAVPKGPSLKPGERRLAVQVEDHPLDYAGFEGIIPKGQYGGGTVAVWDRGTWTPVADAKAGLAKGHLELVLDGDKLHGRWHLVRTSRGGAKPDKPQWLLFKAKDDHANDEIDITESRPESVISGKTIEQIEAEPERVWQSNKSHGGDVSDLVESLPVGFKLTHLDKVLWPDPGVTKGQLVAYLAVVAEAMLPHVANRPLTLVRCPDGIGTGKSRSCFFHKHLVKGAPKAVHAVPIEETTGETAQYMQIDDMAGLVALAQLGTLEIHSWGSHGDSLETPDLMVLDLDPDPSVGWDRVVDAALELRKRLRAIGVDSFVKTTGGKGLHVVAPVTPELGWDDFKAASKELVDGMADAAPDRFTTNMAKAQRRGRIFLDYLRNGRGATFVTPYSPRARTGALIATPITWDELEAGIDPTTFTMATVPRRLGSTGDPWAELPAMRQSLRNNRHR